MGRSTTAEPMGAGRLHGRNLRGADLHGADLRGVDLGDSDLRDADLREIRTGPTPRTAVALVVGALAVSAGLGAVAGIAGARVADLIGSSDAVSRSLGVLLGGAIAVYLIALVWKGARYTVRAVLPPIAALAIASAVIAIASGAGTGAHVVAFAVLITLTAAIAVLGALARTAAGTLGPVAFFVVAIAGAVVGKLEGGGLVAAAIAIAAMIAGQRALHGHEEFAPLERGAAILMARGGTSFARADLRGAHFEGARLVDCDFRGARLDGAHLDRAATTHCIFDDVPERSA